MGLKSKKYPGLGTTPWHGKELAWQALPLVDRLELLRRHYCTGSCGQSSMTSATREATDRALTEAIAVIQHNEQPIDAPTKWGTSDAELD